METTSSVWAKLKVVIWKNFIIRKHHWFLTICEIAVPIVLFLLIAYCRSELSFMQKHYVTTPSYNPEQSRDQFYYNFNHEFKIYYGPETAFTSNLIRNVQLKFSLPNDGIVGFQTVSELNAFYQKHGNNETGIMAIVFNGLSGNSVPKQLNYVIRPYERYIDWETQTLYNSKLHSAFDIQSEKYINRGFIAVQMAIDISFLEMTLGSDPSLEFAMQEFPYPPHLNDMGITDMFLYIMPLVTLFSFVFLCPAVLKRIVEEKSTGIKELMKMMGLKSWMLWVGWFLHAFIVNFISICVITFLMKVPLWNAQYPPIEFCSGSLFFVFLLLYSASGILFCFAISSLFSKPTLAMVVGILVWILSYEVPDALQKPNMKLFKKLLLALFPNTAMNYGYSIISVYETRENGSSWSNLFNSPTGGNDDITMGHVFIMFIVDIILYLLITLYVENVMPGPYGLSKPWNFPIMGIFNKITRRSSRVIDNDEEDNLKQYSKIESAPNLNAGIQIKKLHKVFGNQSAVNGLSIDIYEGQITALLGHNGAGKTTTMLIMTGMIGATSGNVMINNKDIKKNINDIRSSLGLCPQHNLQFTDLTVLEHILFFAMLKGLSYREARSEAVKLLERMNLSQKHNCLASALSGGMRRKLSLAIALIGNAKVLILDEPTSGLDPEARREIWDLLLSMRGSKTILISTHFMEEADVLGDRIAIMDHGRLICYGTSMFLKKEFGAGYHLTLICNNIPNENEEPRRKRIGQITNVIKSVVDNVLLQSVNGNNLTYLLPHESKYLFSKLLEELELKKEALGVSSLAMSVTTLEEVFLRFVNQNCFNIFTTYFLRRVGNMVANDNMKLKNLIKEDTGTISSTTSSLLITILTLYLGDNMNESTEDTFSSLDFNLSIYGDTKVFYGGNNEDLELSEIMKEYDKLVSKQSGAAINVPSVSNAIIEEGIKNIEFYKRHMVVAAEFNKSDDKKIINMMYSNNAIHGAPISLNLVMNSVLKALKGEGYSIVSGNNPLPAMRGTNFDQASEVEVSILWFILFPLGILFLSGTFILFPHMERVSNIKQLQLMCGVRSILYWITCYIWDLFLYCIAVLIIIVIVTLYGGISSNIFSGITEIGALLAILMAYGLSVIPFSYLFSYKKTAAGGFASFLMSCLFVSVIMTVVILIMEFSGDDHYKKVSENLRYICLLFPQFGLAYSSLQFSRKAVWNYNWNNKSPEQRNSKCVFDYNPCCETNFIHRFWDQFLVFVYNKMHPVKVKLDEVDGKNNDDVLNESERVFNTLRKEKNGNTITEMQTAADFNDDLLLVHNLEKIYWGQKVVKGVSFGIKPGDCFGLLGVNGAGKTTTFRMLTGDEPLISGEARIKSIDDIAYISKETKKYLENVGYCPQFDAINEVLTGREMLHLFAELRGISDGVEQEVNMWLHALGLDEYADKLCGKYSGGNKRKLSMAIALIGSPLLVMLDEPTSGVDPVSRRKLWDTLNVIQHQEIKPSIILTSHSMEECEALCNKLAIMKSGELECYGTIPKLKEKYGQGFTVMLKLKSSLISIVVNPLNQDDSDSTASQSQPLSPPQTTEKVDMVTMGDSEEVKSLMKYFEEKYKGFCTLRDKHSGLLHYHINDKKKKWSQLFKEIEEIKQLHPIVEDYTISETTLEEVFLSIARSNIKNDEAVL
ncbi:hypothetical protein FQR65_LT04472 [Abscondita terminalis]|nr:hypothetical protein FQR65_LT04472 [Abscondita terminalis]